MKVTVVAVGKLKEKFYVQAVEEYAKRLSRYCRLEILQVADGAAGTPGSGRERPHRLCHRRLTGTFRRGAEPGRLETELFPDDLSSPADAGDPAGTGVPELSDPERRAVS